MSKKSASVGALEELHGDIAKYLSSRVRDSTTDPDDADDFKLPMATGEVANIIAFLKMNNISAAPDTEVVSELADEFAADLEAQRIAIAANLFKASDEDIEKASWLT